MIYSAHPVYAENDIPSLFSRFAGAAKLGVYHEIHREITAKASLMRWPLLVEIQGLESLGPAEGKSATAIRRA